MSEFTPAADSKPLTLWGQGLATLNTIKYQVGFITLVGFYLPLAFFNLYFGAQSTALVKNILDYAASTADFNVVTVFSMVAGFSNLYSVLALTLAFWISWSLLALIQFTYEFYSNAKLYPLLTCYRLTLRKQLKLILGLPIPLLLLFMAQIFQFVFIILLSLILVFPVIIVIENRSILSSVDYCLSLKYVINGAISKGAAFFHTISISITYVVFNMLASGLKSFLLNLDDHFDLTRELWTLKFPAALLDISLAFTMSEQLSLLLIGINTAMFYVFLTVQYCEFSARFKSF
jgi:hypothetical protein